MRPACAPCALEASFPLLLLKVESGAERVGANVRRLSAYGVPVREACPLSVNLRTVEAGSLSGL